MWGHHDGILESDLLLPDGHDPELSRYLDSRVGLGPESGRYHPRVSGHRWTDRADDCRTNMPGSSEPLGCRKRSPSLRGRWGCASFFKPFRLSGGGRRCVLSHTHSVQCCIQAEDELLREVARATGLTLSDVLRVRPVSVRVLRSVWWSPRHARCAERVEHLSGCRSRGSESSVIEMLEGVPGSGKSYYAVSERLLKWVRAGRRVYVFVDGFYLDRLALFEGVELAVLRTTDYALAIR